jgi:radical SAM-linked protein
LSSLLVSAYQKGCRFDGWSDSFDYSRWKEAGEAVDIDLESYATRTFKIEDPLAWDHIDMGIERSFLTDELQKAEKGHATEDCRWGACQNCGICDFKKIKPIVFKDYHVSTVENENKEKKNNTFKKLKISYQKIGIARFFGHLEMVKLFFRAIQRSDIPVKYSEGFHPLPKVSFDNPLPVGMESLNERFIITVGASFDETMFVEKVNECLPEGLQITGCAVYSKRKSRQRLTNRYQIELTDEEFDPKSATQFFETDSWIIHRKTKSGKKKKIDIRNQIKTLQVMPPNRVVMDVMQTDNGFVQPKEIIRSIFALSDDNLAGSRILKMS